MSRIIGIDYGKKRVGVAVTDTLGIVATPLGTVASNEIYKFLETYFKQESVETIVVGHPKQMNNTTQRTTATPIRITESRCFFPNLGSFLGLGWDLGCSSSWAGVSILSMFFSPFGRSILLLIEGFVNLAR